MKLAALFLWLLIPLTAYGATVVVGSPHVLTRQGGAVCVYLGWGPNWVHLPAHDYRCAWVRFVREGR